LLRPLWAFGFRLLALTLLFGLRLGTAAGCKFLLLACLRFTLVFLPDQFPALLLTALISLSLLLRLYRATLILREDEYQH
jgi:hypothetical protein